MSEAAIAPPSEFFDYIDDLWFTLHHSEDDNRLVLGLRCYLDDSGSDDGSPLVTCGGPLMERLNFKAFSDRWALMYERNQFGGCRLEQPLHMSDFVGLGKYSGLYPEFKRALFRDVAKLINDHKLYSISIAVSQIDYQELLGEDVRNKLMGAYGFAFFALVLAHQAVSEMLATGPLKTSYLVDSGFGHQDQLNGAHKLIEDFERASGEFRHTGALATQSDDEVPPLQAADAIAWASRKMQLCGELPEGFEPLADAISENGSRPHVTIPIPRDGINMLATPIKNWILRHGTMPQLADIVVRHVRGVPVKLKS
jgi:hypothetical protein